MGEREAMSWSEQAETLLKALTEAQMEMWKSWCGLVQTAPASPYPGFVDQWRALADQGLKGWTGESAQIVKEVAKRLLGAQDAMTRFLELSANAWKAMAPKAESGEDWQTALRNYTDTLRQQLLQLPQETQKAFQDGNELWRLYGEQWKGLVQPWTESLRRAPWHFGQASAGDGSALIEFTNLYWDAYERTFGRLLESPSLGHSREMNEDLLKGFDAWLDYRRASFEYQVTLGQTWIQAFEEIMRRLVAQAEKGETVPGVRQLLSLWVEVVDHTFTEVFRSEEYILLQGQLVNAATTYRIREREIVDSFLKASHVASRSELDEGYRRVYELRKEVKELRKAVQALKGEVSSQSTKEAAVGTPVDLPQETA